MKLEGALISLGLSRAKGARPAASELLPLACRNVLIHFLHLRKDQSLLIVLDLEKEEIGRAFF